MDFFKIINFHSFSIGSIIPFIFFIFSAFFFIPIKNKSKAAIHLTFACLYFSIFYLGYIISSCVYHPISAYHRWLTVGSIMFCGIHFVMFFFNFPTEVKPKLAKIYLIAGYSTSIIVILLFFIKSMNSPIVYNINAHYWDFEEYTMSKVVSYTVQFYILCILIVGVWRFITIPEKVRWVSFFICISILVGSVIPTIANTLSRYGSISRDTFIFTVVLLNIFGFFLVVLLYLNNSKERMSFLAKLIGITVVTFLILMQFVGYFLIQEKEISYNNERNISTAFIVKGGDLPADFKYFISYFIDKQRFTEKSKGEYRLDLETIRQEFLNTEIYEKIKVLSSKINRHNIKEILDVKNNYIGGYRKAIGSYVASHENTKQLYNTTEYLNLLNAEIFVHHNKIKMLPDRNFKSELLKYLDKCKPEFEPFKNEISKFCQSTKERDGLLKKEVLKFVTPMRPAGTRNYRLDENKEDHYVGFMYVDLSNSMIYEVGYDYTIYRNIVHGVILNIFIVFGSILLFVRYGFYLFFMNVLIKPVRSLRMGVAKVEKGNFDIDIPVIFEDEIGYVTHAFNKMVGSIKSANEKLKDYAENLEVKVDERTVELKSARDALWGEMQIARKIQEVLLPKNPSIKGYDIVAYMNPADEVGGDYYDVVNFPENDWVVIGDVSGHGVSASLIMIMVRASIRTFLEKDSTVQPSELIESINRVMRDSLEKIGNNPFMMINAFCFKDNAQIEYSGRHTTIFIYRHQTGEVELIRPVGIIISNLDLGEQGQNEKCTLQPGDVILLYSDGIIEARDHDKEFYSEKRLDRVFKKCAHKSPDEIRDSILESLKDYYCEDDVSMVIIKKS